MKRLALEALILTFTMGVVVGMLMLRLFIQFDV